MEGDFMFEVTLRTDVKLTEYEYKKVFNEYVNRYCKVNLDSEYNGVKLSELLQKSSEEKNERVNVVQYLLWFFDENKVNYYKENGLQNKVGEALCMLEDMMEVENYKNDPLLNQLVNLFKDKFGYLKINVKNYTNDIKVQFQKFVWDYLVKVKMQYDLFVFS